VHHSLLATDAPDIWQNKIKYILENDITAMELTFTQVVPLFSVVFLSSLSTYTPICLLFVGSGLAQRTHDRWTSSWWNLQGTLPTSVVDPHSFFSDPEIFVLLCSDSKTNMLTWQFSKAWPSSCVHMYSGTCKIERKKRKHFVLSQVLISDFSELFLFF
jgi:hypothetical protein